MLSVLVCHSYFLRFDEKQQQRAKPYPPLATLQVAALIRKRGHNVSFFDAMLANGVLDFDSELEAAQPDVVVIYEDNYNYLSKMCLGRMRRACRSMIERAHKTGTRVIVAGSDASDAPQGYLSAGADAVLLGEGLGALFALIDRLNRDPRLPLRHLVAGLSDVASTIDQAVAKPGSIAPLPVSNLGERPAWDLVHIDAYEEIWRDAHGHFSLNMAASRGCSFRCNWCAKPIWGDRYLQRPAGEVAAEMLYLKHTYRVDHIWFADDIFGFREDWIQQFGTALEAGGGGVPFMIQSRADLIRPGMAAALQQAGCHEVWIGAESGSQRILDAMNKGTSVPDILRARELLGSRGIRVGFFLMLGYLGEKLEDILATRDLVARAGPDDVGVSVAYPLPGTKFYESVKRQLGYKRNWRESNDLDMMFAGTYRSEFYRIVRNLLHDQVSDGWSTHMEKRWDDLIALESLYRNERVTMPNGRMAMATSSQTP